MPRLSTLVAMIVGAITALPIDDATAAGEAGAWRALEATGSVRYRPPGDRLWWQTATGDVIAPESEIVTDRGGSLLIGRAGEGIEVGPEARLMLPAVQGLNRVWQDGGRVLYRSSPARRLEVETPYASLGGRGTVFQATLDPGLLLVEVEAGAVGMTTRDGAASIDLRPGQAARVRAGQVLTLEVRRAPGEAFHPVQRRAPATVGAPGSSLLAAIGRDGSGGQLHTAPASPRGEPASGSGRGGDGSGSGDRDAGGDGRAGSDGRTDSPDFAGDPGSGGADGAGDDRRDADSSGRGGGDERGEGDRGEKGGRDGPGGGAKGASGAGGGKGGGDKGGGKGGGGKGGGGKGGGGKGGGDKGGGGKGGGKGR